MRLWESAPLAPWCSAPARTRSTTVRMDPQCQPPGQPGPCCGGCHAGGTLAHEGPLWGAWPSPSCCWDAREGCAGSALPYSCHPRWPGGPGVPARSVESLTSSVFSAAISSDSTASSPAPCCPSAEGPVEETLSAVLASCRLSAGAAIDRRSFIASGLASQLLEELLCQQLPEAEPGPTAGPEEWCCTTTTTSLERLRRHDHRFQRTKVCFQEQGWVPAAGTDRDTKVTPCRGQPWECRCAGGQDQGSGAQPCREACGHLCRGVAWHATHGCCARVEAVGSTCPRDRDRGAASHPSRKPCGDRGHGRGPAGQPPPPRPGTWALARSDPPCARQRPDKCWGSPWDAPAARPAHGTASVPRHGQASCAGTACAVLSPEIRHCRGAASSVPRAGREPPWEPEPTRQPRAHQGPSGTPRCCDGELAHGCGSAPGCPPGWWSRGGGREEPRSRQRAGKRDVARSHHGHREREEMPMLESWSRGQEPSGQRQEDSERQPPAPVHGGCPEWDPSPCPGTTNMVRVIARSFELRAQQDAARAERERQAWRRRGAGTADSPPQEPPECSGGQGWLPAEEHGTAGAQAATEPCRGGTAGSHDGEEGRRHGGYSRAPRC
ncbi:uncharacterized protein LOC129203696 [Grus americana]|uniref:uncharacterized protein LOC129203696 n=1 Tax=Grus americana TaxID=9117 RepID=UPI002407A10C|nr:uncharacterized protein LOC129203696 [Grus americana]